MTKITMAELHEIYFTRIGVICGDGEITEVAQEIAESELITYMLDNQKTLEESENLLERFKERIAENNTCH